MSIASEITRIKGKVADSFTACGAKGATIPESEVIANLPTCIESIPAGSQAVLGTKSITANGIYNAVDDSLDGYSKVTVQVSGGEVEIPAGYHRVRFIDYDGTILKVQAVKHGSSATAPDLPEHEDYNFYEWSSPFNNIVAEKDFFALYHINSEYNQEFHFLVKMTEETGLKITMWFGYSTENTSRRCTYSWGDGTPDTTTSSYEPSTAEHTYAEYGTYKIKVRPIAEYTGIASLKLYNAGAYNKINICNPKSCLVGVFLAAKYTSDFPVVTLESAVAGTSMESLTFPNLEYFVYPHGGSFTFYEEGKSGSTTYYYPLFYKCVKLKYLYLGRHTFSGSNSFYLTLNDAKSLTSLVLPKGSHTENANGRYLFYNVRLLGLNYLEFDEEFLFTGVTMQNMRSIRTVKLPSKNTEIPAQFFHTCITLCEITIPEFTEKINSYAFSNCYNLRMVIIERSQSVVILDSTNVFFNTHDDLKIYVPDTLLSSYKIATNWTSYASQIYPMSDLEA